MTMSAFPKSATNFTINLIGLSSFLGGSYYIIRSTQFSVDIKIVLLMLCWAIPIIVLESLFLKSDNKKIIFNLNNIHALNFSRSFIKLIGLLITLLTITLFYWLLPEYHGDFYNPYWDLLRLCFPAFIILSIPYFILLDSISIEPEDAYYQLGRLVLGKNNNVDNIILQQHVLGWLVKVFFLPLMIVYFSQNVNNLARLNLTKILTSFTYFFDFVWEIVFYIDVGVVCAGYCLTLKLFDTHIRSTESTLSGWFFALLCYQPFWGLFSWSYFDYNHDNYTWANWLADNPVLYVIWGSLILVCIVIYTLSSVAFGLRFSNLTHRGILTGGPYRYTKHPAYLAKNISWWLVSIPFISTSDNYTEAIRAIFMLAGLNTIYYMRAKTEEKHLAKDAIYRDYMRAIEVHGLFSKIKRFFTSII
jgi:protein-S-isoprenylcysteine O-methyltransferase Ste14